MFVNIHTQKEKLSNVQSDTKAITRKSEIQSNTVQDTAEVVILQIYCSTDLGYDTRSEYNNTSCLFKYMYIQR